MAVISPTLAVVGVGLAIWGFVAGIDATLNSAGAIVTSIVIFYVESAVLLMATVLAIVGLVRPGAKTVATDRMKSVDPTTSAATL